jgi:hypothetical protein
MKVNKLMSIFPHMQTRISMPPNVKPARVDSEDAIEKMRKIEHTTSSIDENLLELQLQQLRQQQLELELQQKQLENEVKKISLFSKAWKIWSNVATFLSVIVVAILVFASATGANLNEEGFQPFLAIVSMSILVSTLSVATLHLSPVVSLFKRKGRTSNAAIDEKVLLMSGCTRKAETEEETEKPPEEIAPL